ncbi:MAG: hypothetical protein RLZZ04_4112 [Cyanobacteriota bacterium]|jgi:GrpB-like predicted nucleotidyltransferase (UPF0157 family)
MTFIIRIENFGSTSVARLAAKLIINVLIKDNVEEIINIQPQNSKAKGYQVKQIRNLIVKYSLGDSDVD